MAVLSSAKKLGILAVKTFGNTIASGLNGAHCPSKIRQLAINLAQTNHRVTTRMQRRLHGFASDAPIHPLDEETAVHAASLLLAELSTYTAFGAAAVFQVQSIISESRMKEERCEGGLWRDIIEEIEAELARTMELYAEKLHHIGRQVDQLEKEVDQLEKQVDQLGKQIEILEQKQAELV